MITVLCGGVGGSRLLLSLAAVLPAERITAIVNTGDDDWFHGLYVSPDPDIITYALAGEVDPERGWGLRGDTFRWLESLRRFGHDTWFQIGDRDLATHLHRTRLMGDGVPLSEIIADIAHAFGVGVRLLPMSDDRVRTIVTSGGEDLPFQEYLVHRHAPDNVTQIRFDGADAARAAPGVLAAIAAAEAIIIAPSNPIGSIGPILAVPGIRDAIAAAAVPRVAVSPIVGGRSLQPPAAEMLRGLGFPVDAPGVARVYAGLIDALVIDESDAADAARVEAAGARPLISRTLMRDDASRRALALAVLAAARVTP